MRIPPHSKEAEVSLLGGVLLDGEVFGLLTDLSAETFYRESHRHIWRAMERLHERREPIDVVTLTQQLRDESRLEAVGGISYVGGLANQVPTAANIEYYADVVRDKATLRRLISVCGEVAEACYGDVETVDEFAGQASRKIIEAVTERATDIGVSNEEAVDEVAAEFEEQLKSPKSGMLGMPTGLLDYDAATQGLEGGDLTILAARPSMGKSALAGQIATHVASKGYRVLFVSQEMPKKRIVRRLAANLARVDHERIKTGRLQEQHKIARVRQQLQTIRKLPIFWDDSGTVSPETLAAQARRVHVRHGLDLLVVDYLQKLLPSRRAKSREQEVAIAASTCKSLAMELDVHVLALAQLNREVEKRDDKRPTMADLRYSGAIEQDADNVTFIYRDEYYHDNTDAKGIAELIGSKARNGKTGTVYTKWTGKYLRFDNLARD